MTLEIALTVITFLISLLGFFLKQLHEKLMRHDTNINQLTTAVKVIQTENNTLNKRFDNLITAIKDSSNESKQSIKELSLEIKQLSKELSQKKDIER